MYLDNSQQQVYFRQWLVADPVAAVLIAHGLGEHSGRYQHVADFFNRQAIAVYALDHRGHGESAGRRGHISDFSLFSDDLHALAKSVRQQHPTLPIHLLGHSMGGLIATAYALRHDSIIASLALSAPAYGVSGLGNKLSLLLAPLLAKLAPTLSLSSGLDAHAISRDPSVVKAYLDDPLVHSLVTAAWARAFRREQCFVEREIKHLEIPVLMLVAGSDRLTDPLKARILFEKIAAQDKQCIAYPDAFHELLNEPEQQRVMRTLLSWINQRGG